MLTLTFLGVGGAFAKRNYQSNVLIEAWAQGPELQAAPDETLLVDFGTTGPLALDALMRKPGFEYLSAGDVPDYAAIHRVFITHQHADHIGGLEELALMNKFILPARREGKPFKPQLISSATVLLNLWDNSLKGGLCAMPGRIALLQDYFFIMALEDNEPESARFQMFKRYDFELVPTDHLMIRHKYDWPSFGLRIIDRRTDRSVFFSGDTKFDMPVFEPFMEAAWLTFHDVQFADQLDPVHPLLSELRTMPAAIKKKTLLYHYSDDWDCGDYDFVADEFAGLAQPQQRYTLFE